MKLKSSPKYGIEKSQILLDHTNPDIIVLGRDFHNQQLINKKVDYIFCNPPYFEFRTWMIKIIKEANCDESGAFTFFNVSNSNFLSLTSDDLNYQSN